MNTAKIVYCCDPEHSLYGKRLRIDYTPTGKKRFLNMETGKLIKIAERQISTNPPKGKAFT
jgi:hypothetical protein